MHAQVLRCHAITVVSLEPSSAPPSSLVSSPQLQSSSALASACDTASLSRRRDTSSLHSGSPPTGSLAASEQSSAGACAPGTGKSRSLACAFVASTTASRAATQAKPKGSVSKTTWRRTRLAAAMGDVAHLSRSAAEQPSAPSAAWLPRTSAAGPQAAGPASRRGVQPRPRCQPPAASSALSAPPRPLAHGEAPTWQARCRLCTQAGSQAMSRSARTESLLQQNDVPDTQACRVTHARMFWSYCS
jgi:hypothetical protein